MRAFCVGLGIAMIVAGVSAQQKPPAGKSAEEKRAQPKSAPTTLTLTGCVEKGAGPNQFTLNDEVNGKYQVTGSRINRYVGQRVEVAGSPDTARLKVRGGLYPTPNVAGQAGAIDPARAAVAAQPGGPGQGTGDVDLPTFRVKSIKTLGGCR
jgi:hypothetical protein